MAKRIIGSIAASLVLPLAASAVPISIGGIDNVSVFTKKSATSGTPGLLTFSEDGTAGALGEVTTPTGNLPVSLASIAGAAVSFDVFLSDTQNDGSTPFDPASSNIKTARFNGASPTAFSIVDPGTLLPLLTFSVSFIDVTNAKQDAPALGDPDGFVVLGDPSTNQTVVSSELLITGGSLNVAAGGIGHLAVLEVLFVSPDPGIATKAELKGYFADNWTAGTGPAASASTWNLTITPEPSSAALLGFGLLGLLGVARRHRR